MWLPLEVTWGSIKRPYKYQKFVISMQSVPLRSLLLCAAGLLVLGAVFATGRWSARRAPALLTTAVLSGATGKLYTAARDSMLSNNTLLEVKLLERPDTSYQIRRDSGLPHDLRENLGRQPCGAGQDFAYHASAMELEWTQGPPKHGHICSIARSVRQQSDASTWLNYSRRSHGPTRPPTVDEAVVLSWFSCGDGVHEPIEPLSGVARHPRFPTGCDDSLRDDSLRYDLSRKYLFDISYLVLKNACMERRSVGRRAQSVL